MANTQNSNGGWKPEKSQQPVESQDYHASDSRSTRKANRGPAFRTSGRTRERADFRLSRRLFFICKRSRGQSIWPRQGIFAPSSLQHLLRRPNLFDARRNLSEPSNYQDNAVSREISLLTATGQTRYLSCKISVLDSDGSSQGNCSWGRRHRSKGCETGVA